MGLNPGAGGSINMPEGAAKATVAAGCFWGVEHMFRKEFKTKGLYDARVGYIGGDSKNPSYRSVCSGRTGRKLYTLFRIIKGGAVFKGPSLNYNHVLITFWCRCGSSSNDLRSGENHLPPTFGVFL